MMLMNVSRWLTPLFRNRSYLYFHTLDFPAFFINVAVVGLSLLIYIFGSARLEYPLRNTVLVSMGFALLVWLVGWRHAGIGQWASVVALIAQVYVLALMWQRPDMLFLWIVPIILAVMLINTPAAGLVAALETATLAGAAHLSFGLALPRDHQTILLLVLWIASLALTVASLVIENLFNQAATDHDRLQALLKTSRETQQRLAQTLEDLEHSNRQLSLLYDKNIALRKTAEEATEAKTNFIARVSHEIRTPLSMILGITESIIENEDVYAEEIPMDLMDDIHVMRRNSEHLLSLVNDVLDLTRAEASQLILHKEWTDLAAELDKSAAIVSPLAQKKKLELEVNTQRPLPEIYCDRTRIRQVILNLLTNAIRYTDQGKISLSASKDDDSLLICVRDTGTGIEPSDVERVFEPFYRGKGALRPDTIGSGLGLSVCRQFVDLHGGKIWLESLVAAGTSFYVRLPLGGDEPPPRSPASFLSERWPWVEVRRLRSGSFTQRTRRHVMVCTQSEAFLHQIRQLDPHSDYQRVGGVAELAAEAERAPAHTILINAPNLEILLAQMEQATQQIKDTPILGTTFTSLHDQVRLTGASAYVQKPFRNQTLRDAVRQVIERPRNVLIVDDNNDMKKMIVRVFSSEAEFEHTQFTLASSGEETYAALARRKPDVILLDLALPDVSGWDVVARLKEEPAWAAIPVIIVSAHDLNDVPNRSRMVVYMNGDGVSMDELITSAFGQEESADDAPR
jgi:signal transduction histidine kinase/CheY-like chemotaxis protein